MRAPLDIFDRAHTYVEHCRRHYGRQPRRASLAIAWWGLLHSLSRRKKSSGLHDKELRVALVLDGGMGDVLLHHRYIKDFCAQCGPFCLDIYSSISVDVAQKLFGGIPYVNAVCGGRMEETYDLILYSLLVPMTVFRDEKRFEALASPSLKSYVAALENFKERNPQWFAQQDYFMADIVNYARILEIKRTDLPYLTGNLKPIEDASLEFEMPQMAFPWGTRAFITVSRGTGAEADSTKLWPEEYYAELLCKLRERFPEAVFVQIGKLQERKLDADYDLRGETSFEELAALMQSASLHISSEGGTVHLRHLLRGGPSVVFFGPTDPSFYGYLENCNLRAEICTPCEWAQRDWTQRCVRGFSACEALENLSPESVAEAMLKQANISEALCRMS